MSLAYSCKSQISPEIKSESTALDLVKLKGTGQPILTMRTQ
jgi:hypothetical protein